MYQVITVGSVLVDVFVHAPSFESKSTGDKHLICQQLGEKIELDGFQVTTGGGAGNTAVGLTRLGFKTAVISETGRDDFSFLIINDLKREQVATELLILEKKEQTGGSVILIGADGQRTVLVHRGAAAMLDPYDVPLFHTSQAGWIHLSSIGGNQHTLEKIFNIVRRNRETRLSWNPGNKELELIKSGNLSLDLITGDVLFVNQEEWDSVAAQHAALTQIFSQVVVTNGRRGGQIWIKGKPAWEYQSLAVKTVDETGAGDAFCAGYIGGQLLYKSPQDSAAWGVANAASVVKFYGAKLGLLDRERISLSISTQTRL